MGNIGRAVNLWVDTCGSAFDLLFSSPSEWNSDVWTLVQNINGVITLIASALLAVIFFYGVIANSINLKELTEPYFWIKPIMHFVLAEALLAMISQIMLLSFEFCQGVMSRIAGYSKGMSSTTVPGAISDAIDDAGFLSSLGLSVIGLLLLLLCLIMAIILLVTVWGRFLRIYMYTALAPLFIAAAAAEKTSDVSKKFFRSWLNVCLQGVVIMLALIIYAYLISSDSSAAVAMVESGDEMGGVMLWARDFAVGGLVTLGICKGADQFITSLSGL